MNKEIYIPVKDFALKYKMTVQNVYQGIKRGKYKGKKIGGYQLVKDII